MRRGLAIFLIINALIIVFLIRSVFTLLTLLVEDGSADAIHSAEIPPPNSPRIDDRLQLIPKIIHQTYVNDTVPLRWREAQKSCVDLHEDYEYKVGLRVRMHRFKRGRRKLIGCENYSFGPMPSHASSSLPNTLGS